MSTFWAGLGLVLFLYYLLVIARLIVETTRSFARAWRPAGMTAVGLELVYQATDPPMKLFRRWIPPVRLGGVSIDISVLVLLIVLWILRGVVSNLASAS